MRGNMHPPVELVLRSESAKKVGVSNLVDVAGRAHQPQVPKQSGHRSVDERNLDGRLETLDFVGDEVGDFLGGTQVQIGFSKIKGGTQLIGLRQKISPFLVIGVFH